MWAVVLAHTQIWSLPLGSPLGGTGGGSTHSRHICTSPCPGFARVAVIWTADLVSSPSKRDLVSNICSKHSQRVTYFRQLLR